MIPREVQRYILRTTKLKDLQFLTPSWSCIYLYVFRKRKKKQPKMAKWGNARYKEIRKKRNLLVHFYYTRTDTRNGSTQINWHEQKQRNMLQYKNLSPWDRYKLHSSFSSSPILSIIACKLQHIRVVKPDSLMSHFYCKFATFIYQMQSSRDANESIRDELIKAC